MDPLIPDHWLLFALRRNRDRSGETVSITAIHSDGGRQRRNVRLPFPPDALPSTRSITPEPEGEFDRFVLDTITDAVKGFDFLRTRFNEVVPFPVFVHSSGSLLDRPWLDWVRRVANNVDAQTEIVRTPARRFPERRRLKLPVRVRILDNVAGELGQIVRAAEERMLYLADPAVEQHGWQMVYQPFLPMGGDRAPHIFIAHESILRDWAAIWRRWRNGERPRLLITVGGPRSEAAAPSVRAGCAHVHLASRFTSTTTEDVRSLFEGIVHDFPLHEAFHTLVRFESPQPAQGANADALPALVADPGSNQSLRLSDAIEALREEAFELEQQTVQGDPAEFLARLGPAAPPVLATGLPPLARTGEKAASALRIARSSQGFDLRREGGGLVPLSMAAAGLAEVRQEQSQTQEAVNGLISQPEVKEILAKHLERHVDATLLHLDFAGIYLPVSFSEPLAQKEPYRLQVHIGRRGEGSLMAGPVPALDPLLPPQPEDEPHTLHIIVFGKDFIVRSDGSQTVRLPRFGGTVPVYFDLVTPSVGPNMSDDPFKAVQPRQASGFVSAPLAELRFGVYFRNRLLQSFLLRAALGKEPLPDGDRAVEIRCDFTQTARFSNLDGLQPRLLSLAINEDASASHTLMIARGGHSASVHWSEVALARWADGVRNILETATRDAVNGARFAFTADLRVADPQSADFDRTVRKLAIAGGELCDELYLSQTDAEALLNVARHAAPDTIETVRHKPSYFFPWNLLYDFERPEEGSPEDRLPVCRGVAADGHSPCACAGNAPGTSARYCLRGFWGIRHRVEQLIQADEERRDTVEIIGPPRPSATVGFLCPVSDVFTQALAARFNGQPAPFAVEYPAGPGWLARLRASDRPGIIAVVSHLEELPGVSGLPMSRLQLDQAGAWLEPRHFVQEIRVHRSWSTPQSLVLLMACGGGFTRLDTASTLATRFLRLGAAGTVAANCTVFTGLAARFAHDLVTELAANIPMGEAMRRCTETLAREGCPLGFVFTYLGSAELRLAP